LTGSLNIAAMEVIAIPISSLSIGQLEMVSYAISHGSGGGGGGGNPPTPTPPGGQGNPGEGSGSFIKIGDTSIELTGKNIVGTDYDRVKPTQDWINMKEVDNYAAKLRAGEILDPIEIYEVAGKGYFIQDGHHRFVASHITGIPVEVRFYSTGGPVGWPNWLDVIPE